LRTRLVGGALLDALVDAVFDEELDQALPVQLVVELLLLQLQLALAAGGRAAGVRWCRISCTSISTGRRSWMTTMLLEMGTSHWVKA
jgi:hypothetical protein